MADDANRVCIARIGAPHGVRGAVRLHAFTADPADVTAYGPLETEDGARRLKVKSLRPAKNALVAVIEGLNDREDADRLKNVRLFVDRSKLPAPDEDEWYHADLVGLDVRNGAGDTVGTVASMQNFGGGDLMEIRYEGMRQTVYVPFTREAVPAIEVAKGFVIVDPPAGLIDDGRPDADEGETAGEAGRDDAGPEEAA